MKTKLKKILKLSAYTLLCTSSIMAAIGDNMNAGLGVTAGTSLQEQTWVDNYADNGSSSITDGPIAGVDFGTNFIISDSASATSLVDFRNVYYPRIKTNVAGLAFNYKMKNDGGLGHGFYAALDYTRYDDLDFWQAALGHEANIYGYGSNLNFYIPFGGTETYDWSSGSELVSTYGVDWTVSKKVESLGLGATLSHHWHGDIKDNMTAFSLGSEYTFNKNMLTAGAGYQYRDGLDSEKHGYKVYARVPLHKGFVASGMGMYGEKGLNMYKPMKRMLGGVIQAKEIDCSTGMESYSSAGVTACMTSVNNPFSSAEIKAGAVAAVSYTDELTVQEGQTAYIAPNTVVSYDKCTISPKSLLVIGSGSHVLCGEGSTLGLEGQNHYAHIASAEVLKREFALIQDRSAVAHSSFMTKIGINAASEDDGVESITSPEFTLHGKSDLFVDKSTDLGESCLSISTASICVKTTDQYSAVPTSVGGENCENIGGVKFCYSSNANDPITTGSAVPGLFYASTAASYAPGNDNRGASTLDVSVGQNTITMGGGTSTPGVDTNIGIFRTSFVGVNANIIAADSNVTESIFAGGGKSLLNLVGGSTTIARSVFPASSNTIAGIVTHHGPRARLFSNLIDGSRSTYQFSGIYVTADHSNSGYESATASSHSATQSALGLIDNMVILPSKGGSIVNLSHINQKSGYGVSVTASNNLFDLQRYIPVSYTWGTEESASLFGIPYGAPSAFTNAGLSLDTAADPDTGQAGMTLDGNTALVFTGFGTCDANCLAPQKEAFAKYGHGLGNAFNMTERSGDLKIYSPEIEANTALNAFVTSNSGDTADTDSLFGELEMKHMVQYKNTQTVADEGVSTTNISTVADTITSSTANGTSTDSNLNTSQHVIESGTVDGNPYPDAVGPTSSALRQNLGATYTTNPLVNFATENAVSTSGASDTANLTAFENMFQVLGGSEAHTAYTPEERSISFSEMKSTISKTLSKDRTVMGISSIPADIATSGHPTNDFEAIANTENLQAPIRSTAFTSHYLSPSNGVPMTPSELSRYIAASIASNAGDRSGSDSTLFSAVADST